MLSQRHENKNLSFGVRFNDDKVPKYVNSSNAHVAVTYDSEVKIYVEGAKEVVHHVQDTKHILLSQCNSPRNLVIFLYFKLVSIYQIVSADFDRLFFVFFLIDCQSIIKNRRAFAISSACLI